ncbi:MAG TPA: 4-hydroxy-tetrahydrodipicolinate synthase [Gemmataceae bacterium]|jgi:4-hydroxy-tetrahydrodipicolinate synthase|nr:4-hydroxy-tetrahydrodipicolinate synthase [Gemmataceae bacterium]
MRLRGIIPPVVTPMKSNEDVDLPRLRGLIDHLIGKGIHGIFVLGTTSEFYALDPGEKQEVIATAVAHVNRRVPVIAGTGAETTREAIATTKIAEKERVDAVSIITPYYILATQAEMIDHFRRIAENTTLPVLLYNNPATCGGVKLDVDSVARLAEIPNVVGIKDSSGDLQSLIEMIRATPKEKFAVFQGRDTLIAPALQYGATGAVPGTANIVPDLCVAIYDAVQRGDFAAAQTIQSRLSPLRIGLAIGTAPGAIKAAMNLLGMNVGPSRSPIAPLPPEKQENLRAILKQVCG